MLKPSNSRKVKVVSTILDISASLHVSELEEPYRLRVNVVEDGGDLRADLRLFYRRLWQNRDYYTATDKGIRLTKCDLLHLKDVLEMDGISFSDMLLSVFSGGLQWSCSLNSEQSLIVTRKQEGRTTYVDFRRYFIHNVKGNYVPSRRGFKLSYGDIMCISQFEEISRACLVGMLLSSLDVNKQGLVGTPSKLT